MTTQLEQAKLKGATGRIAYAAPRAAHHWRAPFALRCGAFLVDYTLVAGVAACATLVARLLGGGARTSGASVMEFGYLVAFILGGLNFVLLPGFTGQTVGKWATGLRIEGPDGARPTFQRALLRHTVGYLLSLLTLGLGFLLAGFDREGRALHDRIAGTFVARARLRVR